jgi:hypothetical protein
MKKMIKVPHLKSRDITLCQVCRTNKEDVDKFKTGYKEIVHACPECRARLKETLQILHCVTEWVIREFDTHKRSSKQFVLTPINRR